MATDAAGADRDFECYGFSKVNSQGQTQIPADARKALRFEADTRLMLFADLSTPRLIVTVKPLDGDLREPRPGAARMTVSAL